jgi:YD repeat-containing protein
MTSNRRWRPTYRNRSPTNKTPWRRKCTWSNGQVYERNRDLDGHVVSAALGPDNITYGDLSQLFSYDNLNRLISATLAAGQTRGYSYDANGNRTSAAVNASTATYTYPGTSHTLTSLSGATTRSFSYDNAGSVTASGGITYVYDGRGRMKQAGTTTYLVNGLGRRVKKGAPDVYFEYDEAGHLIGEYDSTGAAIQEYVWLADNAGCCGEARRAIRLQHVLRGDGPSRHAPHDHQHVQPGTLDGGA